MGAGAVLLQSDDNGVEHPVCYFSKKFNSAQQNYSVVEKELLAIILALQFFSVYLPPFGPVIFIYTDHHPINFRINSGIKISGSLDEVCCCKSATWM